MKHPFWDSPFAVLPATYESLTEKESVIVFTFRLIEMAALWYVSFHSNYVLS